MPISGNDEEMAKLGWVKSLIYETIMCNENTQGRPILTERDFYAENQRCGTCRSNEYVWLLVHDFDYRGGVFAGCSRCRRTWGVLGEQEVSSEKTTEVTPEKAIEILERTKQPIPPALKVLLQDIRAVEARKRRGLPARPKRVGE